MKTNNHNIDNFQVEETLAADNNNVVNLEIILAFALILLPFGLLIARL